MEENTQQLMAEYSAALGSYLADTGEATRQRAFELGRAAAGEGRGVLDMGALHQQALEHELAQYGQRADTPQLAIRAFEFFRESLSGIETSDRASRDASAQLQLLTTKLQAAITELRREAQERQQAEAAVRATEEKFSAELQAANAELRREADQRQLAEAAVRATEEKFSAELQAANAELRREAQERQRAEAAVRATEEKFSSELQAANDDLRREADQRQQAEAAVRATEEKFSSELQAANDDLRNEAQERQQAEAAVRATEDKFSGELQAANAELRREAQERQRAEAAVRATEEKFSSELQAANAELRREAQERQRAEAAVRATEDKFSAELQAANAELRREANQRQQAEAAVRATEDKFSGELQAANTELRREAQERQRAEAAVRATEEKFSSELQAANAGLRREADQRQLAEAAVRATEEKFSAELQAANTELRNEAQERQQAEAAVRATEDKFSGELQAANAELRREAQERQQAEAAVRATEDKFSAELQAANAELRREAQERQRAESAVRATEDKFSAELQAANAELRREAQERQQAEAAVRATEDKFSGELQAANAKLRREAQERQRAEAAERQSAEKFSKAFRASPVGIAITRRSDGRILEVNDSYLRIIGYTRDQIDGRSTSELGLRAPAQDAATLQAFADNGFVREVETQVQTLSGAWIDLLVSAELIELDGAAAILTIILDITARKYAQEAVRKLNTDLEKQAAKLEALNRELEAFSYSVSHDLRAPLRHVGGYVVMLQKGGGQNLDEKNRRYLAIIAEAATRMGQLIDDLLAFSRVGRTELRTAQFPMQLLVTEVIHELEPDARDRHVAYSVGTLPSVYGDRSMLRQVWANLISNALKYSRTRAEATIEIGAELKDTETVFFIRDNGVGFDMQYVDKLFGVFQRLHGAAEFEGTGIGLANVRRIVDRHGGRTWAEGAVDVGATLYFCLPNSIGEPVNG